MAILFLIHGFIGSGKTTFSKTLEIEKNAVRFTPDEWMVHFYGQNPPQEFFAEYESRNKEMILLMAKGFLQRGHDVVLDFGFWKREDRDKYRAMAKDLGVDCVLYAMESNFERCKQRALKRTEDMPEGALFIDENAFDLFWKDFEPLEFDEVSKII